MNKFLLCLLGAALVGGVFYLGYRMGSGQAPASPATSEPAPPTTKEAPKVTPVGTTVDRKPDDVPKPPKAVKDPDRFRQNLQPGKTYETFSKGVLNARGEDKKWAIKKVITINYAFEATIDREVLENDGVFVKELRHFRSVRSLKVDTVLEDVKLELGPVGTSILNAVAAFYPKAAIITALDGVSLGTALAALRSVGIKPEQITGLSDETAKVFTSLDGLTGKAVRLVYKDGVGVLQLTPVEGEMTSAERDFHQSSVLVSDSLIFPNRDVPVGDEWKVDGANFSNLIDPSLLARVGGKVTLLRGPDVMAGDSKRYQLSVIGGRLELQGSGSADKRLGFFEPRGDLYFSPRDQIIVEATLKGKAKIEKVSTNHLLFETSMRQLADLQVSYVCRITDTPKGRPQ